MTQLILTQANFLQKPVSEFLTLIGKLVSTFKSINHARKIAKSARADAAVLHAMSNRELRDIGISRCDIYRLCYAQHADTDLKTVAMVNANLKGSV